MAFVKTAWVNDAEPDITSDQLNRIELGIEEAHTQAASAQTSAGSASTLATTTKASLDVHTLNVSNPHGTTVKHVGGRHTINAYKRGARGDNATDNTAVLQAALDEIRDSGRPRELYLPGDEGTVYRTNGLWVPSGVRIVSDGAKLYCTGVGPRRSSSPDFDPIVASAVLEVRRQLDLGFTAHVTDVRIEGINIEVPASSVGVYGIAVAGSRVHISDLTITGTPYDCISVDERAANGTPEDVWIERCLLENGKRNCVSLMACRRLWVTDSHIRNCSASTPEFDPGCGIEIEPNTPGQPSADIILARNIITGNAGSGIGVVLTYWTGAAAADSDSILIEGNAIRGNGILAGGAATLTGGIEVRGGVAFEGIRIVGNTIRSQAQGAGVYFNGYAGVGMVTANDLRSNPGGAIVGAPAGSYTTGNLN